MQKKICELHGIPYLDQFNSWWIQYQFENQALVLTEHPISHECGMIQRI